MAALGDPLSQLVAAGVVLRGGKSNAAVAEAAVNTASSRGWRRPLLAWLKLQADDAAQRGNPEQAVRLQRRIALIESAAAPAKSASAP